MVSNSKLLELFDKCKFDELRDALMENTRAEALKKSGVKSTDAAIIKRLIKSIEKMTPALRCVHSFEYCGYDLFALTNGYYVLADNFNFGIENPENMRPLDMSKIFQDPQEYNNSFNVDMDSLRAYLQYIKAFKLDIKENPYIIDTPAGYIGLNPQYLLDSLEYCNTNIIHFQNMKTTLKSPVLIQSGGARFALVLPVHISDVEKAIQRVNEINNKMMEVVA